VLATAPSSRRRALARFLATGLLGTGLAVPAVGCRPEDETGGTSPAPALEAPTPDTAQGRLGAPLRSEHYAIEVSAFEPCGPASKRAARTRRVGVELGIERLGRVQVPANPYYALLVDGGGDVYEATLGGCGAPLGPALPASGASARGWVVFEVPITSHDFTLLYDPELVEVPERPLRIALGR